MKKVLLAGLSAILFIAACKTQKTTTTGTTPVKNKPVASGVLWPYRASATRVIDILHTELHVSFDAKKRYMYGLAVISAKPYFYPVTVAELDARGFDIQKVALLTLPAGSITGKADTVNLQYTYDKSVIKIDLGRTFTREQSFQLVIRYTAKPDELNAGGSSAITEDKGLYFIDPDDKDPNIPFQIWTQGETQASSAWFPTVDRPNEKMTSEIYMRVESKYVTLSNGILAESVADRNGMRTDHWRQDLPHAPYLMMMAVGDFSIIKETWRGKEVSYYVEPQFAPYAKTIFGKTPEMLEFFSNKLGVEYPWQKYSQVCGREYVSGAMENTSATLHGDFVQQDSREILDNDYEDYISHELFHQWFGDLVTCESWSNLPLNESFATYGEYLWNEHKYGKETADYKHYGSGRGYIFQTKRGGKFPLIRYHYEDKEDMFDGHSYNKGGQVLHMLRKYIGDDAFFASLKLYLETNKYKTAEVHNLRMAFEQVTGEDLNWFFNQWFMLPGHPVLDISYEYDEKAGKQKVTIRQTQDTTDGTPVFRIPMAIDLWYGKKAERKNVVIEKAVTTLEFESKIRPDFVNTDADKTLLCEKNDKHTPAEWMYLFRNSILYVDRLEALIALTKNGATTEEGKTVLKEALDDWFFDIRLNAVYRLGGLSETHREKLTALIKSDPNSSVRSAAVDALSETSKREADKDIYLSALQDSSYDVIYSSLTALVSHFRETGLAEADKRAGTTHRSMKLAVAAAYKTSGDEKYQSWFEKNMFTLYGRHMFRFLQEYSAFLKRCSNGTVEKSLPAFQKLYAQTFSSGTKYYIKIVLQSLKQYYQEKANMEEKKIQELKSVKSNATGVEAAEKNKAEAQRMADLIGKTREELK
ncbi:MAG: hypothetical protein Fur0041_00640 [Bacteroidia bacterium]